MAMTAPNERVSVSEVLDDRALSEQLEVAEADGAGGPPRWLVWGAAVAVLLAVAGGAYALFSGAAGTGSTDSMRTHEVTRGELIVTITEDGTVESADNTEIKCEVAGGTTILWLIDDGTHVEEGQKLAELDSAKLEEDITQQKIAEATAKTSYIQAQKEVAVAEKSVTEYIEGTFERDLKDLEAQITIAEENLRTAKNALQYTQRMFRKGYVTKLQLEAKEFAVERANLELDAFKTDKMVLEKYTKEKTLIDLQSKVDTAKAKEESEKAKWDLEKARLERLNSQLEKCEIKAPRDGIVVYANEMSFRGPRGSSSPQIEKGAAVREQQDIFWLPDLSRMQVKTAVHESKVKKVERALRANNGKLPAKIRILDDRFDGFAVSVASRPEPTSFFSSNVKEYAVIVQIAEEREDLRPGLTAEVEILIASLKDVLTLPVAAVVEQGGEFFCWVKTDGGVERRPLVLGMSNNEAVEVKDGVAEGDLVVMNPRAVLEEARGDGEASEEGEDDFGGATVETGPSEDRGSRPGPAEGPDGASRGGPDRGPGPDQPSGPPRGEGSGDGPRGGGGFLSRLDKDGDGRVSRDEAPSFMADRFDEMDANGDGFVDEKEMEALRAKFGGGRRGNGPPPGMDGGGRSFGPPRGAP